MTPPPDDPYRTLGVKPGVSDAELRSAYRRLVREHHPDHNGGSAESESRFEEIQEAYSRIQELRKSTPSPPKPPPSDPAVDARLADIERELREPQRAREEAERARARAAREAREAAADRPGRPRASDEELGYIKTDDSFSKIVSDVWDELSDRFSEARQHPSVKRVEDLIEDLEYRHRPRR